MTHEEYLAALDANTQSRLRWRRLDRTLSVAGSLMLVVSGVAAIFEIAMPFAAHWLGCAFIVASLGPWTMYLRASSRLATITQQRMLDQQSCLQHPEKDS